MTLSSFCESDTEFANRVKSVYKEAFDRDPLLAPHTPIALEVVEKLGQGGMGAVFRVKDHRLGRFAALKVLSDPNERSTLRFLNESSITSRLEHPCIPPVYEAGKTPDGQHFILMKIIEGQTLSKEISEYHKQGRPPEKLEELLAVLVKVGEAIAYANEHAIIHRDLKPANIMVGRYGEVMVMDWGIAKDLEESRNPGESLDFGYTTCAQADESGRLRAEVNVGSGQVLGTPGYLSPEQARGDFLDARCDVFNLGVLLTLLLTGELPTPGDSENSMLAAAIAGITRTPLELDPEVPPELSSLAKKALEVKVQHRLSSAKSFVKNLKAYLSGKDLEVHQYSRTEKILRAAKRQPGGLIGLTLLAILLAITGLYIGEINRSARAEDQVLRQQLESQLQIKAVGLAKQSAELNAKRAREALTLFNSARAAVDHHKDVKVIQRAIHGALAASDRSQMSLVTAAKIYNDAHMLEDLRPILLEITQRFPPAYHSLYQLHKLQLEKNYLEQQIPKSSPHLQRLIELAKDEKQSNEYTLFAQAIEQHQLKNFGEAIHLYNQAEKHNQHMAPLYIYRAHAYLLTGERKKGLADANKAIRIEPHSSLNHCFRATINIKSKNFKNALLDSKTALALAPKNPKLHFKQGRIHEALGMNKEALHDYRNAIKLKKNFFKARYSRAKLFEHIGQAENAIREYQLMLNIKGHSTYTPEIQAAINRLKKP
ncbi:MAG: protein kinase [Planctomycetota bacterium]|nr:protein kinase [Planctomycetota bacterium]